MSPTVLLFRNYVDSHIGHILRVTHNLEYILDSSGKDSPIAPCLPLKCMALAALSWPKEHNTSIVSFNKVPNYRPNLLSVKLLLFMSLCVNTVQLKGKCVLEDSVVEEF